jgi:hypothetical protein
MSSRVGLTEGITIGKAPSEEVDAGQKMHRIPFPFRFGYIYS